MRGAFFWFLSFGGFAAVSLVCGLLVWPQLVAAWPSIEEKIDRFRRLPPLAKLVLLLFVGAFVVYGSTKTNQVDQTSGTNIVEIVEGGTNDVGEVGLQNGESSPGGSASPLFAASPLTVTEEDIARGWQLWEVRTNCNVSYTMPEDATLATNWWVRGAYEDVVRVSGSEFQVPSFRFPYGSNEYCSAWAFTWGKLRFALADASTEIVAVGAPMSAVPYRSRMWSAADTNDSRLVTWENFVLGRASVADYQLPSTNYQLVSAQIELRATGDFIARSNEVENVYRRVDPDDWDGDGWENDDDGNPYEWEDFTDYFYQELPEGANTNAYCWVEIRPKWNSWISFYGDAPSNLEDPYLWAKAGETYRVQLLIGKTYDVEGSQPFDIVAKSDERIEVTEIGAGRCEIVWPVTFTVAEGRAPTGRPRLGATWNDGGKSFYVMPNPSWLRGAVTWTDNYCCDVWGDGTNFTYACDNTCTCEGCTVYGSYWYEGYGLPVWGIPCGCHYVPDQGPVGVSISFDHPAVIYEDAYTNLPDVVVHPVRSNAVLRCSVSGGTYGGTFSVTLNAAAQQKLRKVRGNTLPQNVRIEPGSSRSYEVEYSVLEPSGSVGDIGAEARFLEDFHNKTHTNNASMTAVKVELTAEYDAPENHNPSRHVYGVGEKVRFAVTPQEEAIKLKTEKLDTGDEAYRYELFEGQAEVDASSIREYVCPISASYTPPIRVTLGGVEYRPSISLVEPERVITPEAGFEGCHSPGDVGQSKLVTTNYIGPMTVSFQGIRVAEIPCEDEIPPTGYFATTNFTGFRSHTCYDDNGKPGAGAGYSYPIKPGNRWTVDEAGGGLYPNWSPGRLEWKIPIGWGRLQTDLDRTGTMDEVEYERKWDESSRPLLIGGRTDKYKQVFTIDAEGTSRVEKFGHWLSRGRYCKIILDGVQKKWNHWF